MKLFGKTVERTVITARETYMTDAQEDKFDKEVAKALTEKVIPDRVKK